MSFLIIGVLSLGIAWVVCQARSLEAQGYKGYFWGYFVSISGMMIGLFLLGLGITNNGQTPIFIYSALLVLFSWKAFQRTRIGWIGATLLSLNPLWWGINYFYGRSRWQELRPTIWHYQTILDNRHKRLLVLITLGCICLLAIQLIAFISGGTGSFSNCVMGHYCTHIISPLLFWMTLFLIGGMVCYLIFAVQIGGFYHSMKKWIHVPNQNNGA